MDTMNNICKNVSALVRPRPRSQDSLSTTAKESDKQPTTSKTTDNYDVADVFSTTTPTTNRADTVSTHRENLSTGFVTTTADTVSQQSTLKPTNFFQELFYDMEDDNASELLTTDDYGSGALYDLIDGNLTTSSVINYTTPLSTDDGWVTWWTEQLGNTTSPSDDYGAVVSDANRTNITALIGEFYDDFEHVSENYLMTTLAVLGIVLNILAMIATCRDAHMRPMSRSLQCIFYAAENLFLGCYVGFLQIRGYERRLHRHKEHDLEWKNYYTTLFGMSQAIAAWMLYITATDAYRSVACLTSQRAGIIKRKLKKIPYDIVCIVVLIGVFYSTYLPPVRVLLFEVDHYAFFMCNVPFENHWDFKIREVENDNLFYILYYSMAYIVVTHAWPFFAIASRNKDIIDACHHAQEVLPIQQQAGAAHTLADVEKILMDAKKKQGSQFKKRPPGSYAMTERQSAVLCSALSISVISNMYLVCAALKLVILTFKIFTFIDDFVYGAAIVFFRYLNVY